MTHLWWVRAAVIAASAASVAGCGGSDSDGRQSSTSSDDDDDDTSSGPAGSGGAGEGGAGGAMPIAAGGSAHGGSSTTGTGGSPGCDPGAEQTCYGGPPGTAGVGLCVAGTQTCVADGTWGACQGEVLPADETCATAGDDDCDGQTNEEGAGCSCGPGQTVECYSGPPSTKNVGPCKAGQQTCNQDGTGYGPCNGETTPVTESCLTPGDEDCDGQVNEGGNGCVCVPSSSASCYSGPSGTQNVGVCKAGTKQCNADGTAYGPCAGEVVPTAENCMTPTDDDCDGQAPPCPVDQAIIDIRADVNRNGTVDLADPTEDANETTWDAAHGAVFLANIDDDLSACPSSNQTDAQLAACNDAGDTVTNGSDDLLDLARIKTVPWPAAPADASATISVTSASNVRLFKKSGSSFTSFNPSTATLSSADLKAGVELAIEGKDIVRNDATWTGYVDVTFNVDAGTGPNGSIPDGSDTVRMRMSPVMFRHHLHEPQTAYVTAMSSQGSIDFRNDMSDAIAAAGVPDPMYEFAVSDQWTQDFFETAYMSMPGTNGTQHVIHVNFRSANYTSSGLRAAGKVVFTELRGENVAGAVEYDPNHANFMDTLNSFGNLETIPPYAFNGQAWPLGRVLRGSTPSFYPDPEFDLMVESQGVQPIVYIDTEWLLVGHVDETVSFVKASTPRGWVMLVNDPTLAKNMLQTQENAGQGNTDMFVGKFWSGGASAQISISEVLDDPDVMNESAWSATMVDTQVDVLKQQTGITDPEIVAIPFLHMQSSGYSVAYQPGTVNGIYLSDTDFAVPDPHGPVINGQDIFKQQIANALAPYGVTVHFVEDWNLYHRLLGEVHCGSNLTRKVPSSAKWWESGL